MVGKSSVQEIATLAITREISDSRVADPDLEIGGGHGLPKNFFQPFGPQFGLEIKGGGVPPLDQPLL